MGVRGRVVWDVLGRDAGCAAVKSNIVWRCAVWCVGMGSSGVVCGAMGRNGVVCSGVWRYVVACGGTKWFYWQLVHGGMPVVMIFEAALLSGASRLSPLPARPSEAIFFGSAAFASTLRQ